MMTAVHVGIDVSRDSLAVCILYADDSTDQLSFDNNTRGIRSLTKKLSGLSAEVHVCVEATSTYHFQLCLALHGTAGITIHCTDPRSSSDFRKAWRKRAKTDKLDAKGLAHFSRAIPQLPWEPPRQAVRDLRDYARTSAQLIKDIQSTRNRMHAASHGGVCKTLLREYKLLIDYHKRSLQRLRNAMMEIVKNDAELKRCFELLLTVCGIGEISALAILAELASMPRGLSKAKWVSMAGMDPEARDSGGSTPPRHISRRGNARLRHALFMPALVAVRYSPAVKAYYDRLLEGGKRKMCALFAVMRKLLLAIWGMFNTNTEWDQTKFTQKVPLTSK